VRRLAAVVALSIGLGGCGLNVQSPDLFLLTRSGEGRQLTLLVNDGGTIRCNGGKARPLSDPLLLQARDLETNLDADVLSKLRFVAAPNSVFTYAVRLQDGTLRFPDTAAAEHTELAQTEQFTVQAAQQACGLSG
jgi:hypothetical protein